MHTPRIDVRETVARFYIDIELPGLESKENLTVSWANRRTLLVNATITRSAVEEESAKETNGKGAASAEKESSKNVVHLLVQERQIGQYHRAFSLPVDIDHEALVAKLQFGVLRITLTKEKQEQVKEKAIEVEHTGA
jgi:HSP20 family protein